MGKSVVSNVSYHSNRSSELFSSSVGSSLSTLSATDSENRWTAIKGDLFSLFYHLQVRKLPRLNVFLYFFSLLQIETFACDELFDHWGVIDQYIFSWATYLRNLGRDSYGGTIALLIIGLLYCFIMALLALLIIRDLKNGEEERTKKTNILQALVLVLVPVLYLPFLNAFVGVANCDYTKNRLVNFPDQSCWDIQNTVFGVMGIGGAIVLIGSSAMISLL